MTKAKKVGDMKPKEFGSEIVYYAAPDVIEVPDYHLREFMDESELNKLAHDLKEYGMIEPIVCRSVDSKMTLIAGNRRLEASKRAKMDHIPVRVIDVDEKTAMALSFIENDSREQNTAMEIARYFNKYKTKWNVTQDEMAKVFGLSRQSIGSYIRLLELPKSVQDYIDNGNLNENHALTLLKLEDSKLITSTADTAVKEGWTQLALQGYVDSLIKSSAYLQAQQQVNTEQQTPQPLPTLKEVMGICECCRGEYPRSKIGYYCSGICEACCIEGTTTVKHKYKQVPRITGYEEKTENEQSQGGA